MALTLLKIIKIFKSLVQIKNCNWWRCFKSSDNTVVLGNEEITKVYAGQDGKASLVTGGLILGGDNIETSAKEINYLSGVNGNVQDQIDSKQNTTAVQMLQFKTE